MATHPEAGSSAIPFLFRIDFELESDDTTNEPNVFAEEIKHTIKDMINDQDHLESLVTKSKIQTIRSESTRYLEEFGA